MGSAYGKNVCILYLYEYTIQFNKLRDKFCYPELVLIILFKNTWAI